MASLGLLLVNEGSRFNFLVMEIFLGGDLVNSRDVRARSKTDILRKAYYWRHRRPFGIPRSMHPDYIPETPLNPAISSM